MIKKKPIVFKCKCGNTEEAIVRVGCKVCAKCGSFLVDTDMVNPEEW